MPPIPNVPTDLREPISALVRMSFILRGVLAKVLEEIVEREGHRALPAIVAEKAEYLELADKVIDAWSEHLELEWDDETEEKGQR